MDQSLMMETGNEGSNETVQRVLRVVKNGRWLIALATFVAALVTVGGLAFVPSKYRSEATILIAEQEVSPNLVTPLSQMTVGQKLQGITREVLSRARLVDIIGQFGLFSDQKNLSPDAEVELMRKAIDVEPIDAKDDQFSAFSISFVCETPQLAQGVTRRLASLFIERNLENQATRARSTTDFLDQQLTEKRRRLEDIEQRIRDFKTQYSGELPEERLANEERRSAARSQLDTTSASLNRAKGQQVIWQATLAGDLGSRLTRLKTERTILLKNFTLQHPQVVSKDEQIAQIEAELAWVQSGTPLTQKPRSVTSGDTSIAQLEGQLQANALEIEALSSEIARQTATVTQYERRINAAPTREQQLAGMMRESLDLNADITDVQKKHQQTGMAVDLERRQEGQQFKQLDPASFPLHPYSPQRLKMSLGSALGGAVFGFALAFLLDLKNSSFHSEDELRRRFAPPLLLSIPVLLTPQQQRARNWSTGFEVIAGSVIAVAILAVEFYAYRHP